VFIAGTRPIEPHLEAVHIWTYDLAVELRGSGLVKAHLKWLWNELGVSVKDLPEPWSDSMDEDLRPYVVLAVEPL
jgi:hypothetical protein